VRIDFVITELFVGGAERCLTELAIGLTQAGDKVRVFSIGSLPTGEQRALVDRLEAAGIGVRSCEADSKFQFASAHRQLRRWLRQSPPEICQTFLFHGNVLGTMAAGKAGVDVRIGGIRVVDERFIRRKINRLVIPQMEQVVCVSRAVEQFAKLRLGCREDQSTVIPNSVDVSRYSMVQPFDWTTVGWPADVNVVLFVGRLHAQKGIDLLQEQIDSIAPAGSDRRLLLVGEGPLRKSLESWAEAVGHDRVKCLPWQSNVPPLMRACRLLVLPSRYEGMPNVVLEAMASGRPVVCSDVQGSEELLGHAHQAQVFPSGDSQAMKNLVEQFLSDEVLSGKIGEANQARVRKDFSVAAMVDAYRSLYRNVLTARLDGV
jgi:glycosyltransferase involved in cell wall biosynthesis